MQYNAIHKFFAILDKIVVNNNKIIQIRVSMVWTVSLSHFCVKLEYIRIFEHDV